ncbi:hypothetical protein ACIBQ6_12155 [Nonomuraea sp. NPDC049655]|uniref:hypothetical protein n=1 Tax=Nonomuraea sp. NPDC049655 TaxID=3364355 RepID=UPI00378BFE12
MRDAGGPARLTAFLRGLGDRASRIDHYEHGTPPREALIAEAVRAIVASLT